VNRWIAGLAVLALAAGCRTDGQSVGEKVLVDFGLREAPEGYQTPSDRVFERLRSIGETEMARMNNAARFGEVKFQEDGPLSGAYYKEVKRYERFRPVEANAISRGAQGERGFVGYIDYTYQVYQSERKPNRAAAAAETADIPTGERGNDLFRYRFGPGGDWDGKAGAPAR